MEGTEPVWEPRVYYLPVYTELMSVNPGEGTKLQSPRIPACATASSGRDTAYSICPGDSGEMAPGPSLVMGPLGCSPSRYQKWPDVQGLPT